VWEVEIGGSWLEARLGKKVSITLISKNKPGVIPAMQEVRYRRTAVQG
jgi:hypothetical protein